MKSAVFLIIMVISNMMILAAAAENLYTWTDASGKLHITDEAPPPNARVKEIVRFEPRKTNPFQAPKPKKQDSIDDVSKETKCQDAKKLRRKAKEANEIAEEATQRAIEARVRSDEFKRKVGFDHDRIQQFKYKMKKLEDQAGEAQSLAKEANDKAQQAELQAKLAELEADEGCLQGRNF